MDIKRAVIVDEGANKYREVCCPECKEDGDLELLIYEDDYVQYGCAECGEVIDLDADDMLYNGDDSLWQDM